MPLIQSQCALAEAQIEDLSHEASEGSSSVSEILAFHVSVVRFLIMCTVLRQATSLHCSYLASVARRWAHSSCRRLHTRNPDTLRHCELRNPESLSVQALGPPGLRRILFLDNTDRNGLKPRLEALVRLLKEPRGP